PVELPPDVPTARDIARAYLERRGYTDIKADVTVAPGVDVSFTTVSPEGARCHVEVGGGLTAVRPGLRRAEGVWKVIAKAAVLQATHADVPFVVLTPSLPLPGPIAAALEAVIGPGKPISEIVELPARVTAT